MRKKIQTSLIISIITAICFLTLTSVNGGEIILEYDDYGRLTSTSKTTEGVTSLIEFTYDEVGNLTERDVSSQYTLSVTCDENGSCSHNGQFLIEEDDTLEITITPDAGYAVFSVFSESTVWGSLWSLCTQAPDNTVTLAIDNFGQFKKQNRVKVPFDIYISFYRLTGLTGDVNGDCIVDDTDRYIFGANAYYRTDFKPCDLTGDGRVYLDDYYIFLQHLGETCQ